MIRSAAFSLITLAILMALFYFYWRYQPKIATVSSQGTSTVVPPVPETETQMKVGRGERAWAKSFDDKGRLSSEFKADEFTPLKDRTFKVVHPVSLFFLDNGQYMRVTGDHGIVFSDTGGQGPGETSPTHPPNNGVLQQVRIDFYPSYDALQPTLWIEMNNARFDNDTLRLYTQSYTDENGNTISGDMVPVTVRGDDYEFDGKGLTLRWDDRDHRLQLLEIEHGRRLEIKNPSKVSVPGAPVSQVTSAPVTPVSFLPDDALSRMLVDASPGGAALAPAPAPKPERSTPYRAIFHDNVKIDQGEERVATGDTMTVDFIQGGSKAKPVAASQPVAQASGEGSELPVAVRMSGEAPTTSPVAAEAATPDQAATAPASAPATTQPNQPITIYWTGKLRVTPLDSEPIFPLTQGQAAVRLVGVPVVLTPKGSKVTAAAVDYRSGDSAARLVNSPEIPRIEVTQDRMHFTADSFAYDPATTFATIMGKSDLDMAMEDGQKLNATWTDRGVLHVITKAGQPDTVDHADLYGNVVVDHPHFNLTSHQLGLDLEKTPAAAGDANKQSGVVLKRATAIGNAICNLIQPDKLHREIDGDKLVIGTTPGPDGKPIPRSLVADGSVKAMDPDQTLNADHMEALLKPKAKSATAPADNADDSNAMDLESMVARQHVHAVLKNGTIADASELHVTTPNDEQQVDLFGAAGQPAALNDGKGSTLTGPKIHIVPAKSNLLVDGPGTMTTVRKSTTQPVVVTWADSLDAKGAENTVDIHGKVVERSFEVNGTEDTMNSDSAHIDLMDAPTTQNSDETESTSTDQQFGNKQLKALTLLGKVDGTSVLKAADGSILHRGEIWGSKLSYDAQTQHGEVPGAGKLWVENHKPANQVAAPDATGLGSNYGDLAMKWDDGLSYDKTSQQIVFEHNVDAAFQQDAKDSAIMKMTRAQTVTAYLEPAPTSQPTTQSAASPKMQLSHISAKAPADTAINFKTKGTEFESDFADYDPKTNLLTAKGTDLHPAELYDEDGSKKSVEELIFNIKTELIESAKGLKGEMGK